MSTRALSTIVISFLAAISVLMTAFFVPVPIWVLFLGWASFVAAGGGFLGFRRSAVMNMVGVLSATLTLLAASVLGGGPWIIAACVVFGAGILVAIGGIEEFSYTPGSFFGFASTVGTISATGTAVTDAIAFEHPAITAAVALLIGGVFGVIAERLIGMRVNRRTQSPHAMPADVEPM